MISRPEIGHSLARIRKVLKNSRSTFNFTPELILPVYSSLDQAAAENPRQGQCMAIQFAKQKEPLARIGPWTHFVALITFCPPLSL